MLRASLFIFPAFFACSCTGIPAGWQDAKRAGHGDPVNGAWIGTWRSEATGHTGGLRAVISSVPGRSDVRSFRFRASWAKIFCAGFQLEAGVKRTAPDTWTVTASKDLGRLFGGTFTCNGTIHNDVFSARYDARMDRGIMEMQRLRTNP